MKRFESDLGVYGHPGDVTPWDIRYDPTNRAHLEREADGSFTFRVWAEPGLKEGMLVLRTSDGVVGEPLHRASRGRRFVFWEVNLRFPDGPVEASKIEYSLAFRSPAGSPVYRVPAGISNAVERLDRWTLDPAMARFKTPEWAHGAVIYQIFPDRFANADPLTDPPDVEPWDGPPTSRGFRGGDLTGITGKLPYLAELGVDLIYLNPIFHSPSNHRYDAIDYYTVDPVLGTNEEFKRLVGEAHHLGMRVVIDASFNHVHPSFFAFQDLIEHGDQSEYVGWFDVHEWPIHIKHRPHEPSTWASEWMPVWQQQTGLPIVDVSDEGPVVEPSYDSWYGVATMPRVNLTNADARRYMLDVTSHWIREYGIDGWRMDVARYVDVDFWDDFRATAKAANPDAFLICEVMGDASQWLQGSRFDATMNYTFRDINLGFFAHDEVDGTEFLDRMGTMLAQYGYASAVCNQNLIGSHDTARFLTEAGDERWRLDLAIVCQLTTPGAPSIYYGDEIGLTGANDPGCRGTFPWNDDPTLDPTYQLIRSLTKLRRRRVALRSGTWHPGVGGSNIISYERRQGRTRLLVVINRGRTKNHIGNDGWKRAIWGSADISDETITIPGRRAAILSR